MRVQLPSATPAELVLSAAAADLEPDRVGDGQPVLPADGPAPRGVVVIPDIYGLRPLFDDLTARLSAEQGWSVCAIEPFPGQESLDLDGRMDAVREIDDDRLLSDAEHAAALLRNRGGCDRIAVMGFCMGGMFAMKAAGTGLFDRAVAFYGMIRVPERWRGPASGEPLDALARPEACPTLTILGGRDVWTPAEDVEALGALPNVEIAMYPDAEHGFVHDPARPAHRPDDAVDAWERVYRFLA